MNEDKGARRGAYLMLTFQFLAESAAAAIIATVITLLLTGHVATGFGGVVVYFVVCGAFVGLAGVVVGIRESAEQARDERAGAFRAAQSQDITLAASDVLAEQADLMEEVRALRAEVAELRRPWWKRWRHAG